MDEQFTFWYVAIVEVQLGLEGRAFSKDVLLEGHIVHSGRLLCQQSMEVLKNQVSKKHGAKTIKGLPFKVRQGRTKLCSECEEKYKKNGHSAYNAWVEGKALKVTSIEKVVSVPENTR